MGMWKYTINFGTALREAIEDGNTEETVECLSKCYEELMSKLSKTDKEDLKYEIEDTIDMLNSYEFSSDEEDEENIDYYLAEFYDICDSVRAFVSL